MLKLWYMHFMQCCWAAAQVHVAAAAVSRTPSWQVSTFTLLDRDGDGVVTVGEAAEGYFTPGQEPRQWTHATGIDVHGLWEHTCHQPFLQKDSTVEPDPSGFVDCAAFGSRVLLLQKDMSAAAVLELETVRSWWSEQTFSGAMGVVPPYTEFISGPSQEKAATAVDRAPVQRESINRTAWILISSDWHVEPWYAGDACNITQSFWRDGVVRFDNASLSNMMRCADGATGLRRLPCVLQGKSDPPVEHIETHFAAFRAMHPSPSPGEPPHSFFFGGDTQAHLMNITDQDGAPEWAGFAKSYSMAPAVSKLMEHVLTTVLQEFAPQHIYWAPGNHDGPEDKLFCSDDLSIHAVSMAWAQPLVAAGIVNNDLNRLYPASAGVQDSLNGGLTSTEFFLHTGYYLKKFAALPNERLYVIVTNTNLGMSNTRQNLALASDLAWIAAQHGRAYIIGHHPQTVGCLNEHGLHKCGGDRFIPQQYRSIVRGVFAGHIHSSARTNMTTLFTQVGSVDQAGSDTFFIANISAKQDDFAIILDPDSHQHVAYDRSKVGKVSTAAYWRPVTRHEIAPPGRNISQAWDCTPNMDNHKVLSKPPYSLKNKDIEAGMLNLQDCQRACNASEECFVVVYHGGDRHCHTLTGPVTHAQFVQALQPDSRSDAAVACFNTHGQLTPPKPPPRPLPPPAPPQQYGPHTLPIKPLACFIVIGDWGGEETAPFIESGQVSLAQAMGDFAANARSWSPVSDFIGLGDNFYSCGINCGPLCDRFTTKVPYRKDCKADETNFRFHSVFEAVYSASSLQHLPFRVTSGNHDHHGNVSAQIAYTRLSSRWYYPSWFYIWSRTYIDKATGTKITVDVAMIDTVILTDAFELNDTRVGPPPEVQWEWLEDVLNKSKADYLWVGGHFPVWSGGTHGPTQGLVARLRPLLAKYSAHYMSGHDHVSSMHDEKLGPVYVVAGNGDNCCYNATHAPNLPANSTQFGYWSGGYCPEGAHCPYEEGRKNHTAFATIHFGVDAMAVQFVDSQGEVLWTSRPVPKRKRVGGSGGA